ncbi:MAG: hypothetical protein LBF89_04695 [Bacteroidales bacterium]|jgi:hypothetical protein|nr:hypothetical protein [Bacteroidales bacterium]
MTVFFYDRMFDGLLTAVFDTFNRRTFPEQLLKTGETAPLFTDETHVSVMEAISFKLSWKMGTFPPQKTFFIHTC